MINACATHCCPAHGCKYGYDSPEYNQMRVEAGGVAESCPVAEGKISPVYPANNGCERCEYETQEITELTEMRGLYVISRLYRYVSTDETRTSVERETLAVASTVTAAEQAARGFSEETVVVPETEETRIEVHHVQPGQLIDFTAAPVSFFSHTPQGRPIA